MTVILERLWQLLVDWLFPPGTLQTYTWRTN